MNTEKSERLEGTVLWWNQNGFGVISKPISNSEDVERYFLAQTRIIKGPATPRKGMRVVFERSQLVPSPGKLPFAEAAEVYAEPTASDALAGKKASGGGAA
jgi:cold shock CspA family protein